MKMTEMRFFELMNEETSRQQRLWAKRFLNQPVEMTVPPVKRGDQPIEIKKPPVEISFQPVKIKKPPVKMNLPPVGMFVPPVKMKNQPVKLTFPPVGIRNQPVKTAVPPVDSVFLTGVKENGRNVKNFGRSRNIN